MCIRDRWNSHVENIIKKANKRLYLIRNLKRAACPSSAMLLAYNSVIRPLLLYAYPCFCNFPAYLRERLLKLERRVFRIAGASNDVSVIEAGDIIRWCIPYYEAGDSLCQNLFAQVCSNNNHCLRRCFTQQLTNTRQSLKLRPLRAKGSRLSRSFVRFAR